MANPRTMTFQLLTQVRISKKVEEKVKKGVEKVLTGGAGDDIIAKRSAGAAPSREAGAVRAEERTES